MLVQLNPVDAQHPPLFLTCDDNMAKLAGEGGKNWRQCQRNLLGLTAAAKICMHSQVITGNQI